MKTIQTFQVGDAAVTLTALETSPPTQTSDAQGIQSPGAGKFQIKTVELSAQEISAGDSVQLSVHIEDKGIAYIFIDLLMRDPEREQYYGPVVRDFVMANRTRTVGGVTHPRWDSDLELTLDLRPRLRMLTDGNASTFGFFQPASYDSSEFFLDGLYTSAGDKASRRARLSVDGDGVFKKIVVFEESERGSFPAELRLESGDQFAPYVELIAEAQDEDGWGAMDCIASPITFRGEPFRWEERAPLSGDYLAGILVQDLDGQLTRMYAPLNVK